MYHMPETAWNKTSHVLRAVLAASLVVFATCRQIVLWQGMNAAHEIQSTHSLAKYS